MRQIKKEIARILTRHSDICLLPDCDEMRIKCLGKRSSSFNPRLFLEGFGEVKRLEKQQILKNAFLITPIFFQEIFRFFKNQTQRRLLSLPQTKP